MDHTEFLGDTLIRIAGEKAAIIKRGVPVISAEQPPEAIAVIEQQAKRMHAPLHAAGQEWHVNVERGRLVYQDERGLMDLAAPKLFGRHQFDNAGLAIATLRALDAFRIDAAAFEAGILGAEWPARMQRLASGKLVDLAPPGCELWLDGGHNADGGRVVAAALGDLEERVSRPLVVIAGMMGNKDAEGFLANFAGLTRHIIAVQIPDRDNAMPPDTLADAARHLGMRVETSSGVEAALRSLTRLAYEVPPRILITGSLYLAGHVLAANGTLPSENFATCRGRGAALIKKKKDAADDRIWTRPMRRRKKIRRLKKSWITTSSIMSAVRSPLYFAERLTEHLGGAKIYFKREELEPHRRPQDQQLHRPDPARPAHGQDAHHRRDRRRPAWRRHRHRLRALRPALRRLHGRGGHRAPEAQCVPHEAAGREGRPGAVRHAHPERRNERSAARLGDQCPRHLSTASAR